MRVRSALVALAFVASGAAAAPRSFPVGPAPFLGDAYPDRVTRFAGGITGLADVTYSVTPGYRPQILDLYLPAKGKPRPLVIYIHGGGWVGGHTRQSGALSNFPQVLASLASEGFVVASLEYRLAGEARYPAQLQDVRAAIRFLKDNAAKYGIDPSRVGVWGGSAGGHLTALAALSCGAPGIDDKPAPAGSECVQAAVTWYGVFDFAPIAARLNAPVQLLGCTAGAPCPAERIATASPVTYIDRNDPPFLLIHGTDDQTVPVTQSTDAYAKMKAAGIKAEEIIIPGVDHSFIGKTAEATRAATLQAVNATFDFFHKTLGPK